MDGSMAISAAPRPSPFYISRDYAALWLGQAISFVGDMVFDTTLILWIATRIGAGESWAPAAVGALVFATSLPILLVGPAAGVFVDRWPKRRTLLRMDAMRALLILLLFPLTGLVPLPMVGTGTPPHPGQLAAIYAVVVVATVCSQFFTPARTVLIRDIVSEEDRARAAGLAQTTQSLAIILGPAIAAILISRVGVQPALLFDALTFVVSFAAILSVRSREGRRDEPARESPDFAQELREGIRFCLGNRVLRALLIAMVVTMLGGGALNALDAFFVTQNLHAPAPMLGTINAAYGLGAVFGAVLAAVFARRIQLPLVFCLSVTGFGVAFLVYARMTSLIPAAMLLFLAGFPQAGLSVALGPLVMHLTPRDMLGRISGIFGPMISLATMVSAGIAGLLVSTILRHFHAGILGLHFGPIDTVFTASGALMLAAGLYAMVGLRGVRVDRQGMRDRSPRGVAPPAETPRHETGPALSDTRS